MRITNISPNSYINLYNKNTTQPSFKSQIGAVYDEDGDLLYKTNTSFFRSDLDWDIFSEFLDNKYKFEDRVNIINYGCSDGEESFSLVIKLQETMGKRANKFLPIIAKDLDKSNIKKARSGEYQVYFDNDEIYRISKHTNYSMDKYFDIPAQKYTGYVRIKANKELQNKVIFSQGNILQEASKIPSTNTVLLCRNFWLYLTEGEKEHLASTLSKTLDKSCVVIIGRHDVHAGNADKILEKYGFINEGNYTFTKE